MSACIICVEDYDASSILNKLNIEITLTAELLRTALKDDYLILSNYIFYNNRSNSQSDLLQKC